MRILVFFLSLGLFQELQSQTVLRKYDKPNGSKPVEVLVYNSRKVLTGSYHFKNGELHGRQQAWDSTTATPLFDVQCANGRLHGRQLFWRNGETEPVAEEWHEGAMGAQYKTEIEDGGRVNLEVIWRCELQFQTTGYISGTRSMASLKTMYGTTTTRSLTLFEPTREYTMWYPDGSWYCNGGGDRRHRTGLWKYYYPRTDSLLRLWAEGFPEDEDSSLAEMRAWNDPAIEGMGEKLISYAQENETAEFDENARFTGGNWRYYNPLGWLDEEHTADTIKKYFYHENGKMAVFHAECPDSMWYVDFYPDGTLKTQIHSVGRRDSCMYIFFYPNGKSSAAGIKAGIEVGTWHYWDSLGRKTKIDVYESDGIMRTQYCYKDSQMQPSVQVSAKQFGREKENTEDPEYSPFWNRRFYYYGYRTFYREDGKAWRLETYTKDRFDTIPHLYHLVEWDSMGRTVAIGNGLKVDYYRYRNDSTWYRKDTRVWPQSHWWAPENGGNDCELSAVDTGKLSLRTLRWPNGKPKMLLQFCADSCAGNVLHGLQQGWYENGKPWFEVRVNNGNVHGTAREWYDNGKLKIEWNRCSNACEEELYFTPSGKTLRYSPGYTEESKGVYNRTGNNADLQPKPRSEQVLSLLNDSFLQQLLRR
ncbi:MAG: hypothetical protein JNL57_06525 [Bacteroidetes bacterium]|nr:hypothetical protein [Bacteroidota bacterium]